MFLNTPSPLVSLSAFLEPTGCAKINVLDTENCMLGTVKPFLPSITRALDQIKTWHIQNTKIRFIIPTQHFFILKHTKLQQFFIVFWC